VVHGPFTVEDEGDVLFETLQTLHLPIQYHISENWSLSSHCCENHKPSNSELSFIDVFLTEINENFVEFLDITLYCI
jgi:hypothetical protein